MDPSVENLRSHILASKKVEELIAAQSKDSAQLAFSTSVPHYIVHMTGLGFLISKISAHLCDQYREDTGLVLGIRTPANELTLCVYNLFHSFIFSGNGREAIRSSVEQRFSALLHEELKIRTNP